ncbi:hypothetical protein JCM10213_003706 [Rhodosporidiobolus nylandii]
MDPCELKDRLVLASGELDALYVVHWLQQAQSIRSVHLAVDTEHSWNGHKALTAVASNEFTPTSKLILELLLLGCDEPLQTESYSERLSEGEGWTTAVMEAWTGDGSEKASSQTAAQPFSSTPNPRLQIRLSRIPTILSPQHLHEELAKLVTGCGEILEAAPGTVLVTFANEALAAKAALELKEPLHPIVVEHLAPSRPSGESSSLPPAGLPSLPSSQSLSSRPVKPSDTSKPVTIHIGRLPNLISADDIFAVFRKLAIPIRNLRAVHRARTSSYYCTVPSRDDYVRIREALDGRAMEGKQLIVERERPAASPAHPIVRVTGLPRLGKGRARALETLEHISRSARSAAYDCRLEQPGAGTFRCPSPASAEDAVRRLDGFRTREGAVLAAEWMTTAAEGQAGGEGKGPFLSGGAGETLASLAERSLGQQPAATSSNTCASASPPLFRAPAFNSADSRTPAPAPPSATSYSPSLRSFVRSTTPQYALFCASPGPSASGRGGGERKKRIKEAEAAGDGRPGKRMKKE